MFLLEAQPCGMMLLAESVHPRAATFGHERTCIGLAALLKGSLHALGLFLAII